MYLRRCHRHTTRAVSGYVNPLSLGLLLACVAVTSSAFGQTLTAEDAAGNPTDTVDVAINYDNPTPDGLRGWSFGVAHDTADVTLDSVASGAAVDALNSGAGPDYQEIDLYTDGWTTGVVVSFSLTSTLAPGTDLELNVASYTIDGMSPGETTPIDFVDTLGAPLTIDICFVFVTACTTPTLVSGEITTLDPVAGVRRGDVNGDGTIDADDESALCDIMWPGAPIGCVDQGPAVDCTGAPDTDAADVNDNEAITVADYIRLQAFLDGSSTIPAPSAFCGTDPDDDPRGFGPIDTDYTIRIGDVILVGTDPSVEREVLFPFVIESPTSSIAGFTAMLTFDSGALSIPPDPQDAFVGLGTGVVVAPDASTLVVSRWSTTPGGSLVGQDVGLLRLFLAPFAVFPPLEWIDETTINGGTPDEFTYRATVVDDSYEDHHPELLVGEFEFARGNSNSDGSVNIADSVTTLDFLFNSGPAPNCEDAADANNDSRIDIADAIYTLAYLFSGGPIFPEPFPQCGLDQGPIDILGCNAPLPGDACFE